MIKLVQMDEATFQFFMSQSTSDYAEEKVKSGAWEPDNALKQSKEAMTRFLPRGLHTEGAYLYSVVEEESDTHVGYIWFNVTEGRRGREAFIYDIYIYEPFQDKGYGKQAMQALDEEARSMNISKIGLHVFGQNQRAFELYKKMGFGVTDITMSKDL
ncbi:GNAT family N-acetyltransferase [Paenibacillus sp. URB8-2]|uniref:GNAT family N-acetyltransferase n=1 Tax=Paenibacillus sp. URB8-2 TaxID=2741301 RepID=UPI0015C2B300|nr:GNAT family N-acetyltransferase [Paenibacillus sp. URB8-2]BCG61404.1 putative N-acetyltransferase YycN [Paenibacillus sp. URB8-2]